MVVQDPLIIEADPEIAGLLDRRLPELARGWLDRVRAALPEADGRFSGADLDRYEEQLGALTHLLENPTPPRRRAMSMVARRHGEYRSRQGGTLWELVREYAVFRLKLLELAPSAAETLCSCVDLLMSAAVDAFAKHGAEHLVRDQQQLEQQVHRQEDDIQALALKLEAADQQARRNLSRQLHDGLQQLLVAAIMRCGMMEQDLQTEHQREDLTEVKDLLRESFDLCRNLTARLNPPGLMNENLHEALERLAESFAQRHRLEVQVEVDTSACTDVVAAPIRVLIYEAVRELLFNVVKHAGTHTARVTLRDVDGLLEVTVSDSGAGIDEKAQAEEQTNTPGVGLEVLRHRVQLLGGELSIHSQPGAGTRVRVLLPCPEVAATKAA
jgi:signal transduction histidine kinase